MLADDFAVVFVELKGVAGLRQLAFKVVSEKTKRAIQCDIRHTLEFRTQSRVNSASKAWAHRRIWFGGRSERSSSRVNERIVSASAKAKVWRNGAAAGRRDGAGDSARIKLRLGCSGIAEGGFIHSRRADGSTIAHIECRPMAG